MRLPHIPPIVHLLITVTALWIEGAGFALFLTWWAYDTPKGATIRSALPFADGMIILFAVLLSALQVYGFTHPEHDEDADPPIVVVEDEEDEARESPTPAGYCPGCGHLIAEHPRNVGLACDAWYTGNQDESED